jgi:DNA (cytosine-5)-methyltransferase 1
LAAEWAGFTTVGQCEWADYQTKVLEKHWPDVPKWRDIRTLNAESFYEKTGLRTVDVVSGGFPCQPFSVAGKRQGKDDDRYLWPEMLRVISELRPAWVLGENVPGIVNLALDTVLSDLENIGYTGQAFIIPACGVDAPHKRERVAIVAYTVNRGGSMRRDGELQDIAEDGREGLDNGGRTATAITGQWRQDESGVVGVADGLRGTVHEADPDPDGNGLPGRLPEPLLETFTECSSRERERDGGAGTTVG